MERIDIEASIHHAWSLLLIDPANAYIIAQEAAQAAAQVQDRHGEAHARLILAKYESRFGKRDQAFEQLTELADFFLHQGDVPGQLRTEQALAQIELEKGLSHQASLRLQALLPKLEHLGALDHASLLNTLSIANTSSGDREQGLRLAYHALSLIRRQQGTPVSALINHNIGVYQLNAGNYDLAHKLLHDARHTILPFGRTSLLDLFSANLALCLIHQDLVDAALVIVEPLAHITSASITPRDLGFVQCVAADACFHAREWSRGEHYLQLASTTLGGDDDPFFVGYLAYLHAQHDAQQGDTQSALAQCDIAVAQAERSHDDQLTLDVLNLQAKIHADRQDYKQAYVLSQAFHHHYTRVAANANETRYLTLQVQHELAEAQSARDRARKEHAEAENARQKLTQLNRQLEERIAEIEALQSALREQAVRDVLTGLYNRRHLQDALPQTLQLAIRANWNVCVVLIDLDHFKRLNDTHGHRLGDAALIELGKVLRDGIRGSDFCCRYGGEEFCIVLADMPPTAAQNRLLELLDQLRQRPISDGENQFTGLTFSAGIAATDTFGHDSQQLLHAADKALYQAKAAGRSQVHIAAEL